MSSYRFEILRTYIGEELDDTEDAEQIVAAADIGLGVKAKTPAKFRDAYAKKNDLDPTEISVQVWGAFEGRKKDASFTLIYFGMVGGGVLFHGDTAKHANLMLWPDGFEPIDEKKKTPDAKALTKAFDAK